MLHSVYFPTQITIKRSRKIHTSSHMVNLLCWSILLVVIVSICPYHPSLSNNVVVVVLPVDGWKIGNLFQRHQTNHKNDDHDDCPDNNQNCLKDRIDSPNENQNHHHQKNHEEENDILSTAPTITPTTSTTTTSIEEDESPPMTAALWQSPARAGSSSSSSSSSSLDTITPIPSLLSSILYQSFQVPKRLFETIQQYYDVGKVHIVTTFCHRPPVGMVSVLLLLRFLIRCQRLLLLILMNRDETNKDNGVEDRLFQQKFQQQQRDKRYYNYNDRNQRAYLFNEDDVAYHTYGGIERIRTRLCLASLLHDTSTVTPPTTVSSSPLSSPGTRESVSNYNTTKISSNPIILDEPKLRLQKQLLIQALSVSSFANSGSSWIPYIYDMIQPLAQAEEEQPFICSHLPRVSNDNNHNAMKQSPEMASNRKDDSILTISLMTGKVRLYDSLLRLCRDRVLQTTYRLARTVEHWERRMKYNTRRRNNSNKFSYKNGGRPPSSTSAVQSNTAIPTWLLYKIFPNQQHVENISDDKGCVRLLLMMAIEMVRVRSKWVKT